jgi:hypothetical protein
MNKTIYFAHPISLYNTPFESAVVENLIARGYEVVNPGEAKYQEEYLKRRSSNPEEHVMVYWLELAGTCTECLFVPFPECEPGTEIPYSENLLVGAGVVGEVDSFVRKGLPVYWTWPPNSIEWVDEVQLIAFHDWDDFQRLTVAQTRAVLRAHGVKR